jgi:uncharacterized protein YciI
MKILLISLLMVLTIKSNFAQNPEYDSVLARSLGADELGMKMYVLVILKTGTANITDTAVRARLFRGHFENMNNLARQGKMLTAGPIDDNEQEYRGIFLFNVSDVEEARELVKGDPTVVEHIFEPLFFELYGSAALQQLPALHRKIQKVNLE